MMTPIAAATLAEQLATERFSIGDARSAPYKLGFKKLIISRSSGAPLPRVYAPGTVQFDAYYAGTEDACHVWADYLQRERIAA